MVAGTGDARSLLVTGDAHGVEEGSGEVRLRLGVNAVALYSARRMYVVAVVVVNGNVCHLAGSGVAEEEQVAGAAATPVGGLDSFAGKGLLRGIAHQD